jgi:hypothetical protein
MKKKLLLFLSVIFLISVISYVIIIFGSADEYYITNNFSIKESKEKGVFIYEYVPSQNNIKIFNTIYTFDEIWIENVFHYKNKFHKIEKMKNTQMMIKFRNQISNIKSNNNYGWKTTKKINNCLIYNLKITSPDTIKIYFYSKNDTIPIHFFKRS